MLWNSFVPTGAINSLTDISRNLIESLFESPTQVSGFAKIFANYTPLYGLIIDVRLMLTLAVFAGAVLLPFLMFWYLRGREVSVIITIGWITSSMSSSIALLYAGLPYFSRPALFTFIAWAPLGALAYDALTAKQKSGSYAKIKRLMRSVFLVAFFVLPLLLMPVIKYGPLPFLYPTSKELTSKRFLDLHLGNGGILVYFEYNLPYGYSYILDGHAHVNGPKSLTLGSVYSPDEGLNTSLIDQASLWITYRLVTRDAFRNYTPSMLNVVENVTLLLPETTHNKVYDSGWPECILTPR